jgi:hypothetical protein
LDSVTRLSANFHASWCATGACSLFSGRAPQEKLRGAFCDFHVRFRTEDFGDGQRWLSPPDEFA